MSGLRGSMTPTGKRSKGAFDFGTTTSSTTTAASGQAQPATGAPLSSPIHIQPRSSPRAPTSSIVSANAGIHMAQSCPTFTWNPPAAPHARPRIASIDPPPMELPPSPPVFSHMQAQQIKGKKEAPTGIALKKAIYSRSLSNYSSSAPTNTGEFLSKFQPNFETLDEGVAGDGDELEEEEEEDQTKEELLSSDDEILRGSYRPSARAQQAMMAANLAANQRRAAEEDEASDDSTGLGGAAPVHGRPIGIGIGANRPAVGMKAANRVQAMQQSGNDESMLGKSPTIFSILSTSAKNPSAFLGANATMGAQTTPPTGQAILSSIAAGVDAKRRADVDEEVNDATTPDQGVVTNAADAQGEDDLQFSISLTDEQEGEPEDASNMPLY